MRTTKPFADAPVVTLMRARLDEMAAYKSRAEIAAEIGYSHNMLSNLVIGSNAIPIHKCGTIARVLGLDPGMFFRLALESYQSVPSWGSYRAALIEHGLIANEIGRYTRT
jgi:transcriptional regulator with XRE-family HTH domain